MSLLARVPNFPKLAFSNVGCTFSHFTKDMENWDFSMVADMLYFPIFQISQRVWKLGVLNNSLSFTSQFSQLKHFLFFFACLNFFVDIYFGTYSDLLLSSLIWIHPSASLTFMHLRRGTHFLQPWWKLIFGHFKTANLNITFNHVELIILPSTS